MADIINSDPSALLEQFQQAYYDQIGKRMQIGSEEYIISSIYSYALSHYAELINSSYRNQNIDTASGEFLDNIAKRYNLKRTPDVYSNPWFEGCFQFNHAANLNQNYRAGRFRITIGDHDYVNYNEIEATYPTGRINCGPYGGQTNIPVQKPVNIRFTCIEPHTDEISHEDLVEELKALTDSNDNTIFNTTYNDGSVQYPNLVVLSTASVTPLNSLSYTMDDEEFRKYIVDNKKLYMPGIAGGFEALSKVASSNVTDARVRIQSDIHDPDNGYYTPEDMQFEPGYVDLFIKYRSLVEHPVASNPYNSKQASRHIDTGYIGDLIKNNTDLLVVGQTLRLGGHLPEPRDNVDYPCAMAKPIHPKYTFYVSKAYLQMAFPVTEEIDSLYYLEAFILKYRATVGYVNNKLLKINEPFMPATLATYMVQPLSAFVKDPLNDCGLVEEDREIQYWDIIKDLPCLGLKSIEFPASDNIVDPYAKIDSDPEHFIQIFTGADRYEGPGTQGKGYDAEFEFI